MPEATIQLLDTVPDPGPGLRLVLRGPQTGLQIHQLRQQASNLTGYIHLNKAFQYLGSNYQVQISVADPTSMLNKKRLFFSLCMGIFEYCA